MAPLLTQNCLKYYSSLSQSKFRATVSLSSSNTYNLLVVNCINFISFILLLSLNVKPLQ
jgi:hypothetical protein